MHGHHIPIKSSSTKVKYVKVHYISLNSHLLSTREVHNQQKSENKTPKAP